MYDFNISKHVQKVNAKGYIQYIIIYVKNLNVKYIVKHVYICHKRIKT